MIEALGFGVLASGVASPKVSDMTANTSLEGLI